jgi:predicted PurR-regulated permease PerM
MNRRKGFLISLILGALFLVGLMVAPYAAYLLTGIILAFIGYPLQRKLREYTSESVSASLIILLTLVAAILPFGIMIGAVAGDAADLVRNANSVNIDLGLIEAQLSQLTGQDVDLQSSITDVLRRVGGTVAGSASSLLSLASGIAIGVPLMLFIQFYGLKDGGRFIEWTKKFDVLPTEIQEELYSKTGKTTRAVIKGHVFVAVAQGLIAGLGLALTGVPNFVFWTFVMIILGFIPLIGTMLVWLPASIWLAVNGNITNAAILAVWGIVIVGAVDNFLRPYLVDDDADLHPLFVILGVVGGIGVFGVIGLFLGPVMFGVAKNLLEVYITDYERL